MTAPVDHRQLSVHFKILAPVLASRQVGIEPVALPPFSVQFGWRELASGNDWDVNGPVNAPHLRSFHNFLYLLKVGFVAASRQGRDHGIEPMALPPLSAQWMEGTRCGITTSTPTIVGFHCLQNVSKWWAPVIACDRYSHFSNNEINQLHITILHHGWWELGVATQLAHQRCCQNPVLVERQLSRNDGDLPLQSNRKRQVGHTVASDYRMTSEARVVKNTPTMDGYSVVGRGFCVWRHATHHG